MYVCIYIYIYILTSLSLCICIYIYIHMYIHTCIYTHMQCLMDEVLGDGNFDSKGGLASLTSVEFD